MALGHWRNYAVPRLPAPFASDYGQAINHNLKLSHSTQTKLLLILFLHQTTTCNTTTVIVVRCILFCSYIKPQLYRNRLLFPIRCILFCSYIKPQLDNSKLQMITVVSYSVPTSNHNSPRAMAGAHPLYLILFLHQTTTRKKSFQCQTRCILFCSYIKPQLLGEYGETTFVVSYSVPTSNHNQRPLHLVDGLVVSYSVPTSNHNTALALELVNQVVSYSVPTSNHNLLLTIMKIYLLYLILFLHQTTTSDELLLRGVGCILFCSYIKPQLLSGRVLEPLCCILFCSYIKPQRDMELNGYRVGCILFCSYIKPQLLWNMTG